MAISTWYMLNVSFTMLLDLERTIPTSSALSWWKIVAADVRGTPEDIGLPLRIQQTLTFLAAPFD